MHFVQGTVMGLGVTETFNGNIEKPLPIQGRVTAAR